MRQVAVAGGGRGGAARGGVLGVDTGHTRWRSRRSASACKDCSQMVAMHSCTARQGEGEVKSEGAG